MCLVFLGVPARTADYWPVEISLCTFVWCVFYFASTSFPASCISWLLQLSYPCCGCSAAVVLDNATEDQRAQRWRIKVRNARLGGFCLRSECFVRRRWRAEFPLRLQRRGLPLPDQKIGGSVTCYPLRQIEEIQFSSLSYKIGYPASPNF